MNQDKGPRDIREQIEIAAPVQTVWRALTDAHALAQWFPLMEEDAASGQQK